MLKSFIIILLSAAIVSSCIDPYWPEIDKYQGDLVIDGMITNGPGPYLIRLQTSTSISSPSIKPLSGAEVFITDDLGNIEFFHESEKGLYTNTSSDFKGEIGRSYQLTVSIADNKTYTSTWEKLPKPMDIKSVYAEVEIHETEKDIFFPGCQFYVDTQEANADTTYLLWRLESTYQYQSSFQISFYYDGTLHPFNNIDSLRTCWKTQTIGALKTYRLINSTQQNALRYPLYFVSTEGKELSIKYSLLVKQLSLTKTAFDYWNSLEKQEKIQGSLYTQQPYQIKGNVHNTKNEDEPVMGCFLVAGISTQRIFVDRPYGINFYYKECELREGNFKDYGYRKYLETQFYPYFVVQTDAGARAIPDAGCADCRDSGGKIEKPDFWTD